MKNLYLFQPQQTVDVNGRKSYWLPYSVGCLWSYALQNTLVKENYNLKKIFFKRTAIKKVLEEIENPDVAVFSCYVWNWEYNRTLSKAIKEKWPNCHIVFGGPQVTNRPLENSFFKKNQFVNTIINGEGEIAFQELLIDLINNVEPRKVIKFTRLAELSYPSPYTSGIFDQIINDNPNCGWHMTLETNRGCPYACTFCDWGSLTYSKILKFSESRVIEDFEWASRNKVEYIFIADANFGIFYERDKKFAQHLNNLQTTTGYPSVVIAQWAKNAKEKIINIAKIFFNNHNRGFTVSVQSMNDAVLDAIKRKNMDISDLHSMLELCSKEGISAYTELILGLPYETKETWKENFSKLLDAGQHNHVDVWFCQLLENSELNTVEQRTLHDIKTVNVPKWMIGSRVTDDDWEITEFEAIVKSTRYMPFEDLIDSYMFAHVVLTYHHGGWTQIMSRFLNKFNGLSYLKFYTTFENYIKNSNGLLSNQYHEIKNFIKDTLDSKNSLDQYSKFKNKNFHGAVWDGIDNLAINQDQVFDEIFSAFTPEFCNIDYSIFKALKEFQISWMYNFYKSYPYQQVFDYNVPEYIFNSNLELGRHCEIKFSYPFSWKDITEFREKTYVARRSGVLKSRYKIIDSNQSIITNSN
jgi:putative methyltransferase